MEPHVENPTSWLQQERMLYAQLAHNPNDGQVCLRLGQGYLQQQLWWGALFFLDRALQIEPERLAVHDALGRLYVARGEWSKAIEHFTQAIRLDGGRTPTHWGNRAFCYGQLKTYGLAAADYRRVVERDPAMGGALAESLLQQAQHEFAQEHFVEAAVLLTEAQCYRPNHMKTLLLQARAWLKSGDLAKAATGYGRLLELNPNLPEVHHTLGTILAQDKAHAQQAAHHLRQAVALTHGESRALLNLATHLLSNMDEDFLDESVTLLRQAQEQWPDDALVRYSLGCALLLQGAFTEGWALYESRFAAAAATHTHHYMEASPPTQPLWQGEPLQGKTLLLVGEQGFGDQLQMARLIEPLKKRYGCRVQMVTHPSLMTLFEQIPTLERVWQLGEPPQSGYDYWLPIMSLPHRLGITLPNIPGRLPYLNATRSAVKGWQGQLKKMKGLKVGLVWTGNPLHMKAMHRRVPFEALTAWGEIEGIHFISLQKDPMAGDEQHPLWQKMHHFEAQLTDFHATAALIKNLDLVITVDTAVAHLAGGLGVPVWMMLPCKTDFRWMQQREDSPWYPSMRLFRGRSFENPWPKVIEAVAVALRNATGKR
ncbi:Tetratricopeptide TPR_2 repeat protein [Magnetococcus marinus MC-1]|uniref:Tetratricopeptide TPR_2 repeat protein n=1 Tax=Magnetococcus marinus (strain ATCC BAA-1437 / JCM 17883 / MC-1) TaxID=156889 RepID=A0L8C8_MAGMM|nr:tetratricopeptide repeat protein [Magnetococcus marinus]ABK44221.1 Tetratricopeptide TPR_2 repeat protein [Magnetococcus marinus MC-1]